MNENPFLIDRVHEALFAAEKNLDDVTVLLRDNQKELTEYERVIRNTAARVQSKHPHPLSGKVRNNLYARIDQLSGGWVRLYLRRKELLRVFTEADEGLRRIQDYMQGTDS